MAADKTGNEKIQDVLSNTVKEVKEETGLNVFVEKLIAVQDWRKHNVTNYAYGVVKIFSLCKYKSGKFESNIETTEWCGIKKVDSLFSRIS